jgi:hypothetical protein
MVPWICIADTGVWAGDDEAAVRIPRGGLLILRFMHEVLQRLLMQFEFFELHFNTSFYRPFWTHFPYKTHLSHRKRAMDRYLIGTNHGRPRCPDSPAPSQAAKQFPLHRCILLVGERGSQLSGISAGDSNAAKAVSVLKPAFEAPELLIENLQDIPRPKNSAKNAALRDTKSRKSQIQNRVWLIPISRTFARVAKTSSLCKFRVLRTACCSDSE